MERNDRFRGNSVWNSFHDIQQGSFDLWLVFERVVAVTGGDQAVVRHGWSTCDPDSKVKEAATVNVTKDLSADKSLQEIVERAEAVGDDRPLYDIETEGHSTVCCGSEDARLTRRCGCKATGPAADATPPRSTKNFDEG